MRNYLFLSYFCLLILSGYAQTEVKLGYQGSTRPSYYHYHLGNHAGALLLKTRLTLKHSFEIGLGFDYAEFIYDHQSSAPQPQEGTDIWGNPSYYFQPNPVFVDNGIPQLDLIRDGYQSFLPNEVLGVVYQYPKYIETSVDLRLGYSRNFGEYFGVNLFAINHLGTKGRVFDNFTTIEQLKYNNDENDQTMVELTTIPVYNVSLGTELFLILNQSMTFTLGAGLYDILIPEGDQGELFTLAVYQSQYRRLAVNFGLAVKLLQLRKIKV